MMRKHVRFTPPAVLIGLGLATVAITSAHAASALPSATSGAPGARTDLINTLGGIAPAIIACWHPPHEGDTITLRLSVRRDGSLLGRPRITYSQASGGADGAADLATSIFAALSACMPLHLNPQLGAAIAGRVFLIRFVAPRHEEKA